MRRWEHKAGEISFCSTDFVLVYCTDITNTDSSIYRKASQIYFFMLKIYLILLIPSKKSLSTIQMQKMFRQSDILVLGANLRHSSEESYVIFSKIAELSSMNDHWYIHVNMWVPFKVKSNAATYDLVCISLKLPLIRLYKHVSVGHD